MHKTPESLVFVRDDCDPLYRILTEFFRVHHDQLTEEELTELRSVWDQALDLTLMEDGDSYPSLARRVSHELERPTVLEEGQTTVETSAVPLFAKIIGWAGVNLAAGTTTMQDITQKLLENVGHPNPEIAQVFGEADIRHATVHYPQILITAGALAQRWHIQLTE